MNGYLQRLVERHTTAPEIRPRAASRFEGGGVDASEVSRSGADETVPVAAAQDVTAAVPRAPEPAAPSVARRDGPTEGESVSADEQETGPVFAEPVAARPPRPRPAVEPIDSAAAGDDAPPPPFVQRDVVRAEPVSFADVAPQRARLDDASPPQAPHPARPPVPTAGPIVPRRRLAAARMDRAAAQSIRAAAQSSLTRGDDEGRTREPDVVRVHIGRVEVRAVESREDRGRKAPRARDEAPPLSLDRYLSGSRRP